MKVLSIAVLVFFGFGFAPVAHDTVEAKTLISTSQGSAGITG